MYLKNNAKILLYCIIIHNARIVNGFQVQACCNVHIKAVNSRRMFCF